MSNYESAKMWLTCVSLAVFASGAIAGEIDPVTTAWEQAQRANKKLISISSAAKDPVGQQFVAALRSRIEASSQMALSPSPDCANVLIDLCVDIISLDADPEQRHLSTAYSVVYARFGCFFLVDTDRHNNFVPSKTKDCHTAHINNRIGTVAVDKVAAAAELQADAIYNYASEP